MVEEDVTTRRGSGILERTITVGCIAFMTTRWTLPAGKGGTDAGWPSGGGAHPRRRCAGVARARQERGHQAYTLHLLGDIAVRREPPMPCPPRPIISMPSPWPRNSHAPARSPLRPRARHALRPDGRAALARAALSTAIQMYRAMDMIFWLPQVEAALEQGQGP